MSERGRHPFDDDPFDADDTLIDWLAGGEGATPPSDHPAADRLRAGGRPATNSELATEAEARALFRATRQRARFRRRRTRSGRPAGARTLVAATVIMVASATSAAATTGNLPDPVHRTAAAVLAKIGINIPGPDDGDNEQPSDGGSLDIEADALMPTSTAAVRTSTTEALPPHSTATQ